MFRSFVRPLAIMASAALPFATAAQATIGDGVLAAHVQMSDPTEDASYVYGGHNYCWYDGGWKGAGWYQCGYAWRHGLGWGGAVGWNGWHGGAVWRGGAHIGHHHGGYRGGHYHGGYRGNGAHVGHHGGHRGGGGRRR
jgi:hypothetical protein